jgi:hypothetical protein
MNCDIDTESLCCRRCNARVSSAIVRRNCGTAGLGDMMAAGLEAVGITKARVAAALGVEDCGCVERQESLNALGRKLGIGGKLSDESAEPLTSDQERPAERLTLLPP